MGGNGGGDGLKQSASHLKTEKNAKSGADQPEKNRFGYDESDNGWAGEAQGAEEADLGAPANDVGGDGIGDKKHADDEGDEGKGGEVELKSAEHFFDLLAAPFGGTSAGVSGKMGGKAVEKGRAGGGDFPRGVGAEESFDPIDLAGQAERGLQGGDIGDGEVVVGAKKVGGGLEKKSDTEASLISSRHGEDIVARLKMKPLGEGASEGNGVGFGDEGDSVGGGAEGVLEAVSDKFTIGERVDADEVEKFPRMAWERGDESEGGGDFANGGILAEKREDGFGEAKALAFDGEVRAPSNEVERGTEGAEGGFVDSLNSDDGGDAHG